VLDALELNKFESALPTGPLFSRRDAGERLKEKPDESSLRALHAVDQRGSVRYIQHRNAAS
jgi:hypothetical protein